MMLGMANPIEHRVAHPDIGRSHIHLGAQGASAVGKFAAATLDPTEEETLRGERAVLANAREIIDATSGAFALVDDDENAAVAQLARALHLVQPLADKVADLRPVAGELQDALYRLQEAARTLASLSESVRHDPAFEEAHHLLGLAYLDRHWTRKALDAFRQAQRLNPKRLQYQDLVSYLSRFLTLEPGDVISTGTPSGVGMGRTPPVWLQDRDTVEVEIDGIGSLTNPVVVVRLMAGLFVSASSKITAPSGSAFFNSTANCDMCNGVSSRTERSWAASASARAALSPVNRSTAL